MFSLINSIIILANTQVVYANYALSITSVIFRFIGFVNIFNYDFFAQIGLNVTRYNFSPLFLTYVIIEGLYCTLVDGFIMSTYINNQYNNMIYNLAISVVVFQSISIIIIVPVKKEVHTDKVLLKQMQELHEDHVKRAKELDEAYLKNITEIDTTHLKQMEELNKTIQDIKKSDIEWAKKRKEFDDARRLEYGEAWCVDKELSQV